jgi:uncharacterized membrane protein
VAVVATGATTKQRTTTYKEIMRRTFVLTAALITVLATLAPVSTWAREGAQSVGQGLKCYTAAVLQADGSVKYQRVCYKGI